MILEFSNTNLKILFIIDLESKKARNLPVRGIKMESRPISKKNGSIL
ncbi:hypothetical protein LEP1GSC050_3207 [Leptospira broomii serovar Hurstbridge str. 5399]|uniref:Uncharacterized protein n=1 Tax=Leptospira broomii serovar Hurstbridge str. 5399 TaxID=1049789 RepID=T0F956_9LEPT|nr:hypothetical protein LEP1GSC050_3207 [Leptospira broomii serovar Hurstbridge str. 5399]